MKNTLRILALMALPILASAQTITTNTTLCAAVNATVNAVCLTSTTGVVNQTGIYVDNEYMTVNMSNTQTLAASNAIVPVSRGNRAAGSGPQAHASGARAWVALTPSSSLVPGRNGFNFGTTMTAIGPCVRGNNTYLPLIFPNLNMMRDCNYSTTNTAGVWSDYTTMQSQRLAGTTVVALGTNGAIVVASGSYAITKAGVLAETLGAPTSGAQDGAIIQVYSNTAYAHTVTATGLFFTGTSAVDLATFAAYGGAGFTAVAYGGKWIIISSTGITFS